MILYIFLKFLKFIFFYGLHYSDISLSFGYLFIILPKYRYLQNGMNYLIDLRWHLMSIYLRIDLCKLATLELLYLFLIKFIIYIFYKLIIKNFMVKIIIKISISPTSYKLVILLLHFMCRSVQFLFLYN
jgi:hypothetical protein